MRMEDLLPGCKVDIRITQVMENDDVAATQGIITRPFLMLRVKELNCKCQ